MAEDGTWSSIRRHGLLSAVALLDLFEAPAPLRTQVLGGVRRDKTLLRHPAHGTAVIRDQRPLEFFSDVLTPGTSEKEYLDLLNSRVYLWASLHRPRRCSVLARIGTTTRPCCMWKPHG